MLDADNGRYGGTDTGCLVVVALVLLVAAVSWARRNPGTAAMIVCGLAAIGLAWYVWDSHAQSERRRKTFDSRYGKMLEKLESEFSSMERMLEKTGKLVDTHEATIVDTERRLKSFFS